MRRRVLALAALLAGVTLTLSIARHRSTPSEAARPAQPASQAGPDIEQSWKRRTAGERYRAAMERQGFLAPSRTSTTVPALAPGVQQLFHHKEGFPKAWLAPDERIDWPGPRER